LSSDARWSAPALATPRFTLAMGHEALIGLVLAILAIAADPRLHTGIVRRLCRADEGPFAVARMKPVPGQAGERAVAWSMIGLALLIGLPWVAVDDPQALGFRLRVAAYVPMAMCAAIAAGRLFVRLPHRELLLALLALGVVDRGTQAIAVDRPQPRERLVEGEIVVYPGLVTAIHALGPHIPAGATVIVPERHIAYMVRWYTRAPISLRPEPIPAAERVRILPLNWIEMGSPLDDALLAARDVSTLPLPIGGHPRHANGIVLVPEATWDWALASIPPDARDYWGAWPTR
jgi:hypothetical protein